MNITSCTRIISPAASRSLHRLAGLAREMSLFGAALVFLICCPVLCGAKTQAENYLRADGRIEWQAGGFYEGTFADGTPFQMNLPYPMPEPVARQSEGISPLRGAYWYPRRFAGNALALELKTSTESGFTAVVQDPEDDNASVAERFTGHFSPDKANITGTWTLMRNNKKMDFSMQRVFSYKGVFVSRVIQDAVKPYPFTFSAAFPVIGDPVVDKWIATAVSSCEENQECINSVSVVWLSKDSFSLHDERYGYSHGSAHGQSDADLRHYGVKGTSYHPASLDQFINTSPQCREGITRQLIASLKKQGMSQPESIPVKYLQDTSNFLPTPTGIRFDFHHYEAGSYAEGAPSVFLTRENLGQCLKHLPAYR